MTKKELEEIAAYSHKFGRDMMKSVNNGQPGFSHNLAVKVCARFAVVVFERALDDDTFRKMLLQ